MNHNTAHFPQDSDQRELLLEGSSQPAVEACSKAGEKQMYGLHFQWLPGLRDAQHRGLACLAAQPVSGLHPAGSPAVTECFSIREVGR